MEHTSGTAGERPRSEAGPGGRGRPRAWTNATLHGAAEDAQPTLRDAEPCASEPLVGGLRRGDAIGRFVMLGLLGAGGMGEVFLCYDPELDRRVALKLLRPQRGVRADEARARLLREARAVARLSHPNVVTVHDVAVWEGRVFLAMEHVGGPTLRAWQRARPGAVAAIVEMYRLAGEGLAAAHRAGLVHRDFKPESGLASQVVENTSVPRLRRWYVPIVYQAGRPRQDRAARVRSERLARSRTCVTGIGAQRKESTQP